MSARKVWSSLVLACLAIGCGKKGPPLAPLHLVPASVGEVSARRIEDEARLRFVLPAKNQNGPGIDLARVEIYAMTLVPGVETPPNRELLTRPHLVGEIAVKPPPAEDPPTEDSRPAPGDTVTFTERIPPLTAEPAEPPPRRATPAAAPDRTVDPASSTSAPARETTAVTQPVRIYTIRGVSRRGRPGPPSPRVQIPLAAAPAAPGGVAARHTEKAVIVEWLPAVTIAAAASGYNVYRAEEPHEPLNPAPLTGLSHEHVGAAPGVELCFRVRSVAAAEAVVVEGAVSEPGCVTPTDVFPPAAPKGLSALTTPGAVHLIWDANTEEDLAGYLVLRAETPDETLQALTPTPIRDTSYRDTAVKPGVQYVYAIVALDSASPPNRSAPSTRAEVIAR